MKAVTLQGGPPRVVERAEPVPGPGEALIRVTCAGICGTDLEIARGYMAFDGIAGHEFVGVVEGCSEGEWIGTRVVGEINAACGACAECAAGRPRHCPVRTVLGIAGRDGVFAEKTCLPVGNLHPVPDAVPDDVAVFTEPLAAAYEILEQELLPDAGRVLVMGDGRLGQLCARVLRRRTERVSVLGRHAEKLALLERFGIRGHLGADSVDGRFDLVVEATGNPEGLDLARRFVRPLGTIALKTTIRERSRFDPSGIVIDEIRVVGSRCGPFAPALRHLESEPESVRDLVTARFDLADAAKAFHRASDTDALKVLLLP